MSWRLNQRLWTPFYTMTRERRNLSLLCKFLEDNSRRRLCTRLSSPPKCELWPTLWSSTFIWWRMWQSCQVLIWSSTLIRWRAWQFSSSYMSSSYRTVFLYNLFTHKEIDICSHIYHLVIKSITKRNSRLTLPFPSLVMSFIWRARVKIPSGLPVIQWEEPISEQTIIRSKAHIPGLSVSVS